MAKKSPALSAQVNLYTRAALAENTHRSYRVDLATSGPMAAPSPRQRFNSPNT